MGRNMVALQLEDLLLTRRNHEDAFSNNDLAVCIVRFGIINANDIRPNLNNFFFFKKKEM